MKITCPYCHSEHEIDMESHNYEEDVMHESQCPECDKFFVYRTEIRIEVYPEKADCLNDGGHNYELNHTQPRELSKMECKMCGDRREPTEAERDYHKLGSKQEYFNSLKS
jgi:ssDNA-binding Zn-finger/Zn-ribbon topoisomerase 1